MKFIFGLLVAIGLCIVFPGIGALLVSMWVVMLVIVVGGVLLGTFLFQVSKMFGGE